MVRSKRNKHENKPANLATPPRQIQTTASVIPPVLQSPPTPHKIQSLDEKSLRLDENYLAISPATKNAHNNHITANNAKPFNSTHQNKS